MSTASGDVLAIFHFFLSSVDLRMTVQTGFQNNQNTIGTDCFYYHHFNLLWNLRAKTSGQHVYDENPHLSTI